MIVFRSNDAIRPVPRNSVEGRRVDSGGGGVEPAMICDKLTIPYRANPLQRFSALLSPPVILLASGKWSKDSSFACSSDRF